MSIVAIVRSAAVGVRYYFVGEGECQVVEAIMCWTVGGMS